MQKTRLGITVGLLGAIIYFSTLFGGLFVAIMLTIYVLLFEKNEWVRKNAVKAIIVFILFSIISTIIQLIPDIIACMNYIIGIWGGYISANLLTKIADAMLSLVNIFRNITLILLGIKALNQGTIYIKTVDKLIDKYMGE
ncbi:MAG: hypothetical protein IIY81_08580 [Lachnospiraceae bacterium]|nr:hypothetical protein [Lachnospiraceae bacterium]